jgi:hypothetical protein
VNALQDAQGYEFTTAQYRAQTPYAKDLLKKSIHCTPQEVIECYAYIKGKDARNDFRRQAPINMALIAKYLGEFRTQNRGFADAATINEQRRNTTAQPVVEELRWDAEHARMVPIGSENG